MLYNEYLQNKYDYQEAGSIFLLERKHACLFYKPGKGKTYPCIDAIRDIDKALGGKARVLILSTADAIKNMWNAEILPQDTLPKNTVTMSFTMAIQNATKVKLKKIHWDILVVDECHKIKSNNTQISALVYALSKNIEYVWGLSGTPRGNNDVDIFCQFHNLRISNWGDISYTSFTENCCNREEKYFNKRTVFIPKGINAKYKAGWERNIAMYSQRIGYSEEDNMPELIVKNVSLPYKPTKEYLEAEEGVINIPDYETTLNKLTAITKLHQVANGFLYLDNGIEEKRKVYHIERNKKLDWLKNNIQTGEKIVIVYRFAADLENIQNEFSSANYTDNIEEFKTNEDKYILLLQCSRCESFNLQICNKIIFYTMDYSYIKYNQMLHRVWRLGQTKPVKIIVLTQQYTVEDKIWSAVQNKEKFSDLFMNIKDSIISK